MIYAREGVDVCSTLFPYISTKNLRKWVDKVSCCVVSCHRRKKMRRERRRIDARGNQGGTPFLDGFVSEEEENDPGRDRPGGRMFPVNDRPI
jgi:hypothetical protein